MSPSCDNKESVMMTPRVRYSSLTCLAMAALLTVSVSAQAENFTMNTLTLDASGKLLGSANVRGNDLGKLFQAQKDLVHNILDKVGIKSKDLPPEVQRQINQPHTNSVPALEAFSEGLDLVDKGQFAEAKQAFGRAKQLDPGFGLARHMANAMPNVNLHRQENRGSGSGNAKNQGGGDKGGKGEGNQGGKGEGNQDGKGGGGPTLEQALHHMGQVAMKEGNSEAGKMAGPGSFDVSRLIDVPLSGQNNTGMLPPPPPPGPFPGNAAMEDMVKREMVENKRPPDDRITNDNIAQAPMPVDSGYLAMFVRQTESNTLELNPFFNTSPLTPNTTTDQTVYQFGNESGSASFNYSSRKITNLETGGANVTVSQSFTSSQINRFAGNSFLGTLGTMTLSGPIGETGYEVPGNNFYYAAAASTPSSNLERMRTDGAGRSYRGFFDPDINSFGSAPTSDFGGGASVGGSSNDGDSANSVKIQNLQMREANSPVVIGTLYTNTVTPIQIRGGGGFGQAFFRSSGSNGCSNSASCLNYLNLTGYTSSNPEQNALSFVMQASNIPIDDQGRFSGSVLNGRYTDMSIYNSGWGSLSSSDSLGLAQIAGTVAGPNGEGIMGSFVLSSTTGAYGGWGVFGLPGVNISPYYDAITYPETTITSSSYGEGISFFVVGTDGRISLNPFIRDITKGEMSNKTRITQEPWPAGNQTAIGFVEAYDSTPQTDDGVIIYSAMELKNNVMNMNLNLPVTETITAVEANSEPIGEWARFSVPAIPGVGSLAGGYGYRVSAVVPDRPPTSGDYTYSSTNMVQGLIYHESNGSGTAEQITSGSVTANINFDSNTASNISVTGTSTNYQMQAQVASASLNRLSSFTAGTGQTDGATATIGPRNNMGTANYARINGQVAGSTGQGLMGTFAVGRQVSSTEAYASHGVYVATRQNNAQ